MIKNIDKAIEGKKLTVKVVCHVRQYAVLPIKVLTTQHLIDILKEDYDKLKLLKEPTRPVANTNRQKMSNSGTWVFEIEEIEEKKADNNEKANKQPKPKPVPTKKRTSRARKPKTNTSIRSRMSQLANKKD